MSILQQQQSTALNQLHDISEYTSYIDRRIYKLNQLYHSLEINKKKQQKKPSKFQRAQKNTTPSKFYQTTKEPFEHNRRKDLSTPTQAFWNTYYQPQKKFFYDSISNSIRIRDKLKSDQFYRTSSPGQNFSTLHKSRRKANSKTDGNQQRLKIYQQAKQQMLGTFFVGGRTSPCKRNQLADTIRYSECNSYDLRARKGRVWHGRPPVKIVQRYE